MIGHSIGRRCVQAVQHRGAERLYGNEWIATAKGPPTRVLHETRARYANVCFLDAMDNVVEHPLFDAEPPVVWPAGKSEHPSAVHNHDPVVPSFVVNVQPIHSETREVRTHNVQPVVGYANRQG